VRTTGNRCGRLARTIPSSQGRFYLQHFSVEEQKRTEGLVLGRGGDLPVDGQGAEEARDLGRRHLRGMALVVEEDVAPDPRDIRVLGAATVVTSAKSAADAIEQARLRRTGRTGLTNGGDEAERGVLERYRVHD